MAAARNTEPKGISVYFKRPEKWCQRIYIYCWDLQPPSMYKEEWPGVPMGYGSNDWYVHNFNTAIIANIIFNDGTERTADLYCDRTAWFYTDGRWYDDNPELSQSARPLSIERPARVSTLDHTVPAPSARTETAEQSSSASTKSQNRTKSKTPEATEPAQSDAAVPASSSSGDDALEADSELSTAAAEHPAAAVAEGANEMPPILSNNLPEPVAYSGRNYIKLQVRTPTGEVMSDDWFVPVPTTPSSPQRVIASSALSIAGTIADVTSISRMLTISETAMPVAATFRPDLLRSNSLSEKLASLTVGDCRIMQEIGLQPVVYSSPLSGKLTYQVIATPPDEPGGPAPYPTTPGSGPGTVSSVSLSIRHPQRGQSFTGPGNGLVVHVVASATLRGEGSDAIASVATRLDGGPWHPASRVATSEEDWESDVTINQAGNHVIEVRALSSATRARTQSVNFSVSLSSPAPRDTTPPTVSVISPRNGDTIIGQERAFQIALKGTASDPSGITAVSVQADDGTVAQASPKAAGDWSEWTASLTLATTSGDHQLTVSATDGEGNVGRLPLFVRLSPVPVTVPGRPGLYLVESCTLSSYLGAYGAGRVLKTFSLLPGERTTISVRSYTKQTQTRSETSTILDSLTTESEDDFERSLAEEQTNMRDYKESFNYQASVQASATWGVASAQLAAGITGGTNAARNEMSKNIINATNKHAQRRSSKRDVEINTEYEETTTQTDETSIERVVENINVSRTLNFVFRQMNQEFVTLLHLTDVRLAYLRTDTVGGQRQFAYLETSLSQLDDFLKQVIADPNHWPLIKEAVIDQLSFIADYQDNMHRFIEEKVFTDANGAPIPSSSYWRIPKPYESTYEDATTGTSISVPGIILAATTNVLRTEGVMVDAFLGVGDALDGYSRSLQEKAIEARSMENEKSKEDARKLAIANKISEDGDQSKAEVFKTVFPCCPKVVLGCQPGKHSDGKSE